MAEHPEKLKLPLQALRVGDAVMASMPCEIFCEIGLEFKKRSSLPAGVPDFLEPRLTTDTYLHRSSTNWAAMKPGSAPIAWKCKRRTRCSRLCWT